MNKNTEETLRTLVAQTLAIPIFTQHTLQAGLLVWGCKECLSILVINHYNTQLAKLITKESYSTFLSKAPVIEVTEEKFNQLLKTHQIIRYE